MRGYKALSSLAMRGILPRVSTTIRVEGGNSRDVVPCGKGGIVLCSCFAAIHIGVHVAPVGKEAHLRCITYLPRQVGAFDLSMCIVSMCSTQLQKKT